MNALHLAVCGNHVEVVRTLVGEFGLSVTRRDSVSWWTGLHVYAHSDSTEVCASSDQDHSLFYDCSERSVVNLLCVL